MVPTDQIDLVVSVVGLDGFWLACSMQSAGSRKVSFRHVGEGARGHHAPPELLPSHHGACTALVPAAPISLGFKVTSLRRLLFLTKVGFESQIYGPIPPAISFICAVQLVGLNMCLLLYPCPSQSSPPVPGTSYVLTEYMRNST